MSVLAKLAFVPDTKHIATVAGQMLDVAVRVEDVRPFAVQTLLPMLADPQLATNARKEMAAASAAAATKPPAALPIADAPAAGADGEGAAAAHSTEALGAGHVLYAAAWIVGEYCAVIPPAMHGAVIDALLQPGALTLPPTVQGVYVQCALKVLSAAAAAAGKSMARDRTGSTASASGPGSSGSAGADFLGLATSVVARLEPFSRSVHVEVQVRSLCRCSSSWLWFGSPPLRVFLQLSKLYHRTPSRVFPSPLHNLQERACLIQHLLASLGVPFTPAPEVAAKLAAAAAPPAEGDAAAAAAPALVKPPTAYAPAGGADVRLISQVLAALFSESRRPVNPKAQKKVPVPEGLDLDAWINPAEGEF